MKKYGLVIVTSSCLIILEARVWERNIGESVEATLRQYKGRELPLCIEPQGEALAIEHNGNGFYTLSEAEGEHKPTEPINIPLYYYQLSGRQPKEIG